MGVGWRVRTAAHAEHSGYRRLRAGPDWVKPGLDVLLAGLMARQDGDFSRPQL